MYINFGVIWKNLNLHMYINPSIYLSRDKIWVGGSPEYYKTADLMAQGSFHGVISEMSVDKSRIGLWNFDSTYGCKATYPGKKSIYLHVYLSDYVTIFYIFTYINS